MLGVHTHTVRALIHSQQRVILSKPIYWLDHSNCTSFIAPFASPRYECVCAASKTRHLSFPIYLLTRCKYISSMTPSHHEYKCANYNCYSLRYLWHRPLCLFTFHIFALTLLLDANSNCMDFQYFFFFGEWMFPLQLYQRLNMFVSQLFGHV